MIIIPELKKIAAANDKIEKLSKIVETKIDTDDLYLRGATLIDGCSEKNGHLFLTVVNSTMVASQITRTTVIGIAEILKTTSMAHCISKQTFRDSLLLYLFIDEVLTCVRFFSKQKELITTIGLKDRSLPI